MSLFRIRIEDGKPVFVEPMPIGNRIRDIAEIADGNIVIRTDGDFLMYLGPSTTESADQLYA